MRNLGFWIFLNSLKSQIPFRVRSNSAQRRKRKSCLRGKSGHDHQRFEVIRGRAIAVADVFLCLLSFCVCKFSGLTLDGYGLSDVATLISEHCDP
jgi:hypothetical protein